MKEIGENEIVVLGVRGPHILFLAVDLCGSKVA